MLSWIGLSALLFVAYKTNPDQESFKAFITKTDKNPTTTTAKISSFFTRVISGVPEFKYDSWVFFSLVSLKDQTATYMGLFGHWFVLAEVQGRTKMLRKEKDNDDSGSTSQSTTSELDEFADAERQRANKAKANKDYITAGEAFYSVALRLQKSPNEYHQVEAAMAYEDAYKAFKIINETERALQCLEKAATLFGASGQHGSQAGRLYKQLGDLYKERGTQSNGVRAIEMYEKSAQLFESNDDGRSKTQYANVATLATEFGQYERSISVLDKLIPNYANDPLLSFRLKDYMYLYCLCVIGLDDFVRLEKMSRKFENEFSTWKGTNEHQLIQSLIEAHKAKDVARYSQACRDFDQTKPLPGWQIELLLKGKRHIDAIR